VSTPVAAEEQRNTITAGVSWDAYAAIKAVSITRLKVIERSPLHYRHNLSNPKESRPLTLGRAAHCAALEPERFAAVYCAWARSTSSGGMAPRKGKHWEAFKAANAGKEIVSAQDYGHATAIQTAIRSSDDAMRYLDHGTAEVMLRWNAFGRECKGRADWLTQIDAQDVIVGLKTARDCRPRDFGRDARRYGYHLQWAFYADGFKAITGRMPKMVEIVVESAAPYAVAVYVIPDEVLTEGFDEYTDLLARLDECEKLDRWPGPVQGEQILILPSWGNEEQIETIDYVE
jgi:hypothetical protein